MNTTYTQKNDTVQKVANSNAESVKDSSIQNDSLQRKADMANGSAQRAADPRPNNTGLSDDLKTGIESLSGFSMDDVRVHYNSSRPASVQALAYTQGTDIHVAPGQEQHLPHEAWHVAQQMAGRVAPTTNINGMPVNDNAGLEHEADVMGERALQRKVSGSREQNETRVNPSSVIQCLKKDDTTEKFWEHHIISDDKYKSDLNRLKLNNVFSQITTKDLKTKTNDALKGILGEFGSRFLNELKKAVKNINPSGDKYDETSLKNAKKRIINNTNTHKKAQKRKSYNSVSCHQILDNYKGKLGEYDVETLSSGNNENSETKQGRTRLVVARIEGKNLMCHFGD